MIVLTWRDDVREWGKIITGIACAVAAVVIASRTGTMIQSSSQIGLQFFKAAAIPFVATLFYFEETWKKRPTTTLFLAGVFSLSVALFLFYSNGVMSCGDSFSWQFLKAGICWTDGS